MQNYNEIQVNDSHTDRDTHAKSKHSGYLPVMPLAAVVVIALSKLRSLLSFASNQ